MISWRADEPVHRLEVFGSHLSASHDLDVITCSLEHPADGSGTLDCSPFTA